MRRPYCWLCERHRYADGGCACTDHQEDCEALEEMYRAEDAAARANALAMGLNPDDFAPPSDDAALDRERARGYEREQQLNDKATWGD